MLSVRTYHKGRGREGEYRCLRLFGQSPFFGLAVLGRRDKVQRRPRCRRESSGGTSMRGRKKAEGKLIGIRRTLYIIKKKGASLTSRSFVVIVQ